MRKANGATPLAALDAVALDTETTGLDATSARIVQIGAVSLRAGRLIGGETFESLVDPRVPIPAETTAIHHITDAMVAGAPSVGAALQTFDDFAAGRVVIGYAIGFDLAVIEAEAGRAGLVWTRPRTLCVRLLAALVAPQLPDQSLDMLAGWLEVPIADRHSALGDARAAGAIFVRLVPLLAERGVRTLAEAERACLALTGQLERQHRAGWAEPISRPERFAGPGALGAVDPFAYRHRVSALMSAPPVVMRTDQTLEAAIALMVENGIGALFVSDDGVGGAALDDYAIVTERDVMRRIASGGAAAFAVPVGAIASRPLHSVRAGAFAYRAIGRMDRLNIRHLAVRDADGRLAGIVSARDLLRLRARAAIGLDDEIEAAGDAAAMAAAWSGLPAIAQALIGEEIDARLIAAIVSEELRALTRRAAQIAEAAMLAEGRGAPPCPYALIVLGSAGRGESLLAPDQDNAIVFAHGAPDGPEDAWFSALGEKIAPLLDAAGVPLCTGGVMAKNPFWRGSEAVWRERVAGWVAHSRPQDLLNVDIFFDMVPVHGAARLATELFDHAFQLASANIGFAKLLGERLLGGADPFTLLGGFTTVAGRIDLKMHGLFPIVSLARTLAIRHDLRLRGTRERLEGLIAKGIGGEADLRALIEAHALIVRLMLAQQARDLLAGVAVSNRVEIAALTRHERAMLKTALKRARLVPEIARALMFA